MKMSVLDLGFCKIHTPPRIATYRLVQFIVQQIWYIQSCEDLSTMNLLKCNDDWRDGCWALGVMSSIPLYLMQVPAGSEQCGKHHIGVKLMQFSGACQKEGQFGQWHRCEGDEKLTRLLWLDQRFHKAAALLNSKAQLGLVWYTFFLHFCSSRVTNSNSSLYSHATSNINPPGLQLVWIPVKNCSVWWQEFNLYSVNSHWFRLRNLDSGSWSRRGS